jgi:hypothetical protein
MFYVYRFGPLIGRPETPPRLSVCYQTRMAAWALTRATQARAQDGALYWIAKANRPAHRPGTGLRAVIDRP